MIFAVGLWVRELYLHLREVDKGAGLGRWSPVVVRDGTGAAVQDPTSDKPPGRRAWKEPVFRAQKHRGQLVCI